VKAEATKSDVDEFSSSVQSFHGLFPATRCLLKTVNQAWLGSDEDPEIDGFYGRVHRYLRKPVDFPQFFPQLWKSLGRDQTDISKPGSRVKNGVTGRVRANLGRSETLTQDRPR
jgi:hypothetical protein